jgi:hypothetical protein
LAGRYEGFGDFERGTGSTNDQDRAHSEPIVVAALACWDVLGVAEFTFYSRLE